MGHQNSSRPMEQQLWIYENSFYKNLAGWVVKVISMLDEFFTEKDMKQRSHHIKTWMKMEGFQKAGGLERFSKDTFSVSNKGFQGH